MEGATARTCSAEDSVNENQRRAVEELLSGRTQAEVGVLLGVTERTIRNWIREPAVAELIREGRVQLRADAARLLSRTNEIAVRALTTVLEDGRCRGYERVAAARALLTTGHRWDQEDLLAGHARRQLAAATEELNEAKSEAEELRKQLGVMQQEVERLQELVGPEEELDEWEELEKDRDEWCIKATEAEARARRAEAKLAAVGGAKPLGQSKANEAEANGAYDVTELPALRHSVGQFDAECGGTAEARISPEDDRESHPTHARLSTLDLTKGEPSAERTEPSSASPDPEAQKPRFSSGVERMVRNEDSGFTGSRRRDWW